MAKSLGFSLSLNEDDLVPTLLYQPPRSVGPDSETDVQLVEAFSFYSTSYEKHKVHTSVPQTDSPQMTSGVAILWRKIENAPDGVALVRTMVYAERHSSPGSGLGYGVRI